MKTRLMCGACLAAATLHLQMESAYGQGSAFTYQGRLNDFSNPANGLYDLRFALYDAAVNGQQIGAAVTNSHTEITGGLFTVSLDFGSVFNAGTRWLEIGVRTNGGGAFAPLGQRQALTPAPYATYAQTAGTAATAGSVAAGNVTGTLALGQLPGAVVTNNAAGVVLAGAFAGNGAGMTNVNAASFEGFHSGDFWRLGGNSVQTGQFLGSTNNGPLQLRVNDLGGLHLAPGGSNSVNVIGGWLGNSVAPGVVGATIAGGGAGNFYTKAYTNRVEGDFGTVSGGAGNLIGSTSHGTISGGYENAIPSGGNSVIAGGAGNTNEAYSGTIGGGILNRIEPGGQSSTIGGGTMNAMVGPVHFAAIGGGQNNTIQGLVSHAGIAGGFMNRIQNFCDYATISGGNGNTIEAFGREGTIGGGSGNTIQNHGYAGFIGGGSLNTIYSNAALCTIGGGDQNTIAAFGSYSSIGGGSANTILENATYATIPGGFLNSAGTYSLAAGCRAKANHRGSFVWADYTLADFASTANNQFLIRASGGVGINKNDPSAPLDVNGAIVATDGTIRGGFNVDKENTNDGTLDRGALRIGDGAGVGIASKKTWGGNQHGLDFYTAGSSRLSLDYSGNLQVRGNVWTQTHPIYLRDYNMSKDGLGYFGAGNPFGEVFAPDGPILFGNSGGLLVSCSDGYKVALSWDNQQRVGIGKINPAVALDVNGEVSAPFVTATSQLRLNGARTVISGFDGNGSHWFGPSPDSDLAFELRRRAANDYSFTVKGDFYGWSFNATCDRNAKDNFSPVDSEAVLDKVVSLPLSEWNYKSDTGTRHLGPMAQDFRAAFGVGPDDKHIATVDADGVALAAIQGLNHKVEARTQSSDTRIQKLETENQDLKQQVAELRAALVALAEKVDGGAQ